MPSGYFALGDSMSIDAYAGGPGLGAASLLADDLGIDLTMLAADGATSDDVVRRQLGQVHGRPALITLTMGGNDLLTTLVSSPAPAALSAAVTRIAENYETALMSLAATGARVIATTVYDPSDGTGDLSLVGLPEMAGGAAVLDTLNAMIRESAGRHGAALADVHAAFLGHGTSAGDISSPDSHPANRDLWFCGHIEPNAWGARAIRDAWRRALQPS